MHKLITRSGYLIIYVKIRKHFTKTSSITAKNAENHSFGVEIMPIFTKNEIFHALEVIVSIVDEYLKNVSVF